MFTRPSQYEYFARFWAAFARPSAYGRRGAPVTFRERIVSLLKNIGLRSLAVWNARKRPEPPKVIVRKDRFTAVSRSWVHILPLPVTVGLAALLLRGYFIGGDYNGSAAPLNQTLDQLGLQVAAKLQELLIVASLGVMVMDALRHTLLFREKGLPLGIIAAAHGGFSQPSYFWSPEFWYGCKGFRSFRWALAFGLMLSLAGVMAFLTGPATALLMLPAFRNTWPAGAATFWLKGTPSDLWPASLDVSHIGGETCQQTVSSTANLISFETSGCIWNGWSAVAQWARATSSNDGSGNITVHDLAIARNLEYVTSDPSAAVSPHAAVGIPASYVAWVWWYATYLSDSNHLAMAKRNLHDRLRMSSVLSVDGSIPWARAQCTSNENVTLGANGSTLEYPLILEHDFVGHQETSYAVNTSYGAGNQINTTWWKFSDPDGTVMLTNGSRTEYKPSSFLSVAIPYPGRNDSGSVFTCSVDAQWAPGINIGEHIAAETAPGVSYLLSAKWKNNPPTDGAWKTVDLQLDWLNSLTPQVSACINSMSGCLDNNGSNTTTISTLGSVLQAFGVDNSTGGLPHTSDYALLTPTIETAIVLLVVDGMSRVGYAANGGEYFTEKASDAAGSDYSREFFEDILNGRAVFPPPGGKAGDDFSNNSTQMDWTVTVAGYSYLADNAGYKLALALLVIHAALAFCHTVFRFIVGRSSDTWAIRSEFLLLAQQSEPSPGLRDTSAGIDKGSTLEKPVRVRATSSSGVQSSPSGRHRGEQVQMVFEHSETHKELVQVDEEYGAEQVP